MITRFYVDNYKCLVNFEYKPQPLELIIGANGSGKSTVFEALEKVRQFLTGQVDSSELFRIKHKTLWNDKFTQVYELEIEGEEGKSTYRLELNLSFSEVRVEKEIFQHSNGLKFESVWGELGENGYNVKDVDSEFNEHFNEYRLVKMGKSGATIPLSNPNQSMMVTLSTLLVRPYLDRLIFCKLNPQLMASEFGKMTPRLNVNGSNFASYYLYVLQQKQGAMFEVISQLREVLNGFDSFAVDEDFEQGKRRLMVLFKNPNSAKTNGRGPLKIPFDDLSDGQRALIVLYTLLFCALDENATLVIDEPENYIALAELQPLIFAMEQRMAEQGGQILMISHNPEFINMLTDQGRSIRFYRENNGHTRIAKFDPDPEFELTAAEIVARRLETNEQ